MVRLMAASMSPGVSPSNRIPLAAFMASGPAATPGSVTVSTMPPTREHMGTVPYTMAYTGASPKGSNRLPCSKMSPPAYNKCARLSS